MFAAIGKPSPREDSSNNEQSADDYPIKRGPVGLRANPCVITGVPQITLRLCFPSHQHGDGSKQNGHNPKHRSVAERSLFALHDIQFYSGFSPTSALGSW